MIHTEDINGISVLTLSRGKANALDLEFCTEIVKAVEDILASESGGLILTGNENIFSAGVDLPRILNEDASYTSSFLFQLRKLFETLFTFPKPFVAAINGHAIAGGCVMACCADFRVMAHGKGRVGAPELRVGVPFPTVALEIMRFSLSGRRLDQVMFGGLTVEPMEALSLGLVDSLVPADQLMSEAMLRIESLASLPRAVFALTKQQLRAPIVDRFLRSPFDKDVDNLWQSPETRKSIEKFVSEKIKKSAS